MEPLKRWLDRLLVADVFVVIAGAFWFLAAVLCEARGIHQPLAVFQRLWEPLFTPAIGLLMASAVISGVLGWWGRRRSAIGDTAAQSSPHQNQH